MVQQNATNLTPQQIEFIEYVARGRRTLEGKKQSRETFAKKLGVDRSTLYRWQADIPDFWVQVHTRMNTDLMAHVPDVILAMRDRALEGDVAAAKLVLNQANALRPAPKTELNLELESKQPFVVEVVNYSNAKVER